MKKCLLLLLILLSTCPLFAQLEVKEGSFKEVPGFVNINVDKMYDDNDRPYAVLKIKTENIGSKQRRELNFGGDAQTFFEVEYKDGEVWLYISYYASFIKISHEEFSSTEFYFPFDMKPKCGYELTLVNKFNYNPVPDKPNFNYLIIKTDQADATISIDGQYAGEGQIAKSFKVGENHAWKIECDMYHTESGSITIVKDTVAMTVDKVLRPAFGYVNIVSNPENGATVFIDNKKVGETPFRSDRLKSGEHTVRVMKEMFSTIEKTFVISDGNTTELKLNMAANFVNVKVTTDKDANIYIDNELVGKSAWSGRMTEGDHVFEARKESHRNSVYNCKLVLGKDENIVIPNPEPIYGVLDISTTPMGAKIIIDGKTYGVTPRIINDILIGEHNLRLEKPNCATLEKQVTILENEMITVNETLSEAKNVTISSDSKGDKIFVNGIYVGTSPVTTNIKFGKAKIAAEHNGVREEKTIDITQTSDVNIKLVIGAVVNINTYNYDCYYSLMHNDLKLNQEVNIRDEIYIDNTLVSSNINKLSLGKHKIVTKRNGVTRRKTIRIKSNDNITLDVNTSKQKKWFGCECLLGGKKASGLKGDFSLSCGFNYDWTFIQWINKNKLKKGNFNIISYGMAIKMGLYYSYRNMVFYVSNGNYYGYDEEITYKNATIPLLLKGFLAIDSYDLLWIAIGPMWSFNGKVTQKYNTLNNLNAINGLNMRFDIGVSVLCFTFGYTYILPLNNQRTFNDDSLGGSYISMCLRINTKTIKNLF